MISARESAETLRVSRLSIAFDTSGSRSLIKSGIRHGFRFVFANYTGVRVLSATRTMTNENNTS